MVALLLQRYILDESAIEQFVFGIILRGVYKT